VSKLSDIPLHTYLESQKAFLKRGTTTRLSCFIFDHAFHWFSPNTSLSGGNLHTIYQDAMSQLRNSNSVNFLFTREWMLLVPRKASKTSTGVSVNSLGFAGYLLARNEQEMALLKDPLGVLEEVILVNEQKL
jgi:ATP adenylyltransferase